MPYLTSRHPRPACLARSDNEGATTLMARGLLLVLLLGWLATLGMPTSARAETAEQKPLTVSYVGTDTLYLDGGRSHGLGVGQTVTILRDGVPVAEVQVAYLSIRSASCKVISSRSEILLGDLAVPVPLERTAEALVVGAEDADQTIETKPSRRSSAAAEARAERRAARATATEAERPWANLSGTISLRWHQFDDGSDTPRDFNQTTVRLNIRAREIGGGPYSARVRVRGREDRRFRESEATSTERRDRLYEAAVAYEPPDGRLSLQVGRLSSSPLIGFDYLDGGLAEVQVKKRWGVGGFYGQRSEVDRFGFGSSGQTYGAFLHYQRKRSKETPFYADILLGGIREFEESEISREYLSFYGRLGNGSRWSLYQRADIDINGSWRGDATDEAYQLSNLLTTANYRFSDSLRMGISYDHRRRFRDFDNRDTPEEIFDDRLREGFRLTAQIGDTRGWRLTSSAGIRREQAGAEDAYTVTGSVFHTNVANRSVLLGLDFSGFSGESAQGYRASVRGRKYFGSGHDLGLTVGTSTTSNTVTEITDDQQSNWVRLNGTLRLPKRFFVLGEFEVTEGDDLAGERMILQLGYRL